MVTWLRLLTAGALMLAPVLAVAAGFDCKQAANSVERTICDDAALSALDSRMMDAFGQARHRASDDESLVRDQRNWLASRNEMISMHYDNENVARQQMQGIKRTYAARIDFLNHLFIESNQKSPFLEAIALKLEKSAHSGDKGDLDYPSMWNALGGDGTIFDVASDQTYSAGELRSHLPVDDDAAVSKLLEDLGSSSDADRVGLSLLPAVRFGGVSRVGGTLYCVDWSLFAWEGQTIHAIETPKILAQNCWTTYGTLASFGGGIYAIADSVGLASSDIEIQQRKDGAWSSSNRLLVRYDYALSKPTGHCAGANHECDALTAQAFAYAGRYSRSGVVESLDVTLSVAERTKFEAMRAAAASDSSLVDLPAFGATLTGYRQFADGSVWFPVRWHGELMLGRIGHGGLGWRSDENWSVGVWRWDGSAFDPVIGVVVPTQRAGFLLSAIMQ